MERFGQPWCRGVCAKAQVTGNNAEYSTSIKCRKTATVEIGLVGFEPTASWSRTRRSTKLSHSPKSIGSPGIPGYCICYFAYFGADSKELALDPLMATQNRLHGTAAEKAADGTV